MMYFDKEFLFPFRDVDDVELVNIQMDCLSDHLQCHFKYYNLNCKSFNHIDHKMSEIENYIDLENHFFNDVNNNCCEYYIEDKFNRNVNMEGALSIIHLNSRSDYENNHTH